MVNQRRYKKGKKSHRLKTGRVKRSRVKRTKMRGGSNNPLETPQISDIQKILNDNKNFPIASSKKSGYGNKYNSTTPSGKKSKTLRRR